MRTCYGEAYIFKIMSVYAYLGLDSSAAWMGDVVRQKHWLVTDDRGSGHPKKSLNQGRVRWEKKTLCMVVILPIGQYERAQLAVCHVPEQC